MVCLNESMVTQMIQKKAKQWCHFLKLSMLVRFFTPSTTIPPLATLMLQMFYLITTLKRKNQF